MKYSFINQEIVDILKRNVLLNDDTVCFLLGLHFGLLPYTGTPYIANSVLSLGIVNMDPSTKTLVWKYPLLETSSKGFEWIPEWMDLFKKVSPTRRGNKAEVVKRMKKFFVENPSVRKDDVFKATKRYLQTVDNPTFCKTSHKFIKEREDSLLETYLQISDEESNSYTNEMI